MAARTVVCPECAEPVTVGRLSCPKCGSLVASVAGAAPDAIESSASERVAPVGRGTTGAASRQSPAARASAAALRSAPPRSASVAAPPDETVATDSEPVPGATRAPRRRLSTRLTNGGATPTPAAWPTPEDAPHSGANGAVAAVAAPTPTNGSLVPRRDDEAARSGLSLRPTNRLGIGQPNPFTLDQAAAATADGAAGPAWPAHPAGAYLPPSAVFGARTAQPVSADALRARRGAANANGIATDDLGWSGDTDVAASAPLGGAPGPVAAAEGLLASLRVDVPTTVADWLVAAGSAVAAIGFLLPWSENVIGAKGIGTYLDAWGLASPPNFIVFLLALAALALTVIPNGVPVWVRTGTVGLLLGGVLLGLVWPYLVGGWAGGAQVGVLGETVASVLLIVGGVLVQRAMRHGGATPVV